MNIRINNRDTMFTIDTYNMFTLDYEEESIVHDIIREEESQNKAIEADDVYELYEFDYDMQGYIKELASSSVHILKQELVGLPKHFDAHGIVQDIKLEETASPKFYNYTTDSYTATWLIDEKKLKEYIDKNAQVFYEFVDEEWSFEYQKAIEELDEETKNVIRLDFMTRQEVNEDSYIEQMFEQSDGYEYITAKKIEV